MWPFKPKKQPEPAPKKNDPKFKAGDFSERSYPEITIPTHVVDGITMDAKFNRFGLGPVEGIPQLVGEWYMRQGFIGHVQAAWMAKHWLIDKAINMPARDALRQGWELDEVDEAAQTRLTQADKRHQITERLHELIASARRTGGAVAILLTCPSTEDETAYYEAPLNLDAITEYHGISVVDAADAQGEPLTSDLTNPASLNYMTPTVYRIGSRRYHKSHCIAITPYPVADTLKPMYGYWGASLPERIYERVYAAERTANEAPLLAMTKRLRVLGVDLESVLAGDSMAILEHNVRGLQSMADNLGVFVYDTANGGGLSQLDTTLTDVDVTIMTQYQLVAAIAEIPVTRLLGMTPKGFNATGEAEAEDYRQHLESIQTHDLQPLLEAHYRIVCKLENIETEPKVTWLPLDSPTAAEFAEIDSKNGATIAALVGQMVLSPEQGATILAQNKESMFWGVEPPVSGLGDEAEGLLDEVMAELNDQNNPET